MFKKYLTDHKKNIDLYMPRNEKQVDEVIEIIKKRYERVLPSKKSK
jgi:hypothetical protein